MSNAYMTPQQFLDWIPLRFAGELSDDIGGLTPSNPVIQHALDEASEEFDSAAMVRDDIPIPAINGDGTTPTRVNQFMRRVALFNLYARRGVISEDVRDFLDIEMTWLNDVVRRRKNVKIINEAGKEVTETTELPLTGWGNFSGRRVRKKRRLFDFFTF